MPEKFIPMTRAEFLALCGGSTTCSLRKAGQAIGYSESSTYRSVEDNTFPLPIIEVRGVKKVSTWRIARYLGITPEELAGITDDPVPAEVAAAAQSA
jgi:predicted DNA-binding transcriptional regulator AlpA